MKKQISLVLETPEKFDELVLIKDLKEFLAGFEFDEVKIIGTHVKVQKPFKKNQ